MKRDSHLKTLSWEHHDGLVAAFRVKKALRSGIEAASVSKYILSTWENQLKHHFWQEETILEKNKTGLLENTELTIRMLAEHKEMATIIRELEQKTSDLVELCNRFAEMLEKHIRFEERELFPFLEQNLSGKDIQEAGKFLWEQHPQNKTCAIPPAWEKEEKGIQ